MESLRIAEARLEPVQGDITCESTDAIVNAANSGLRGGGGVDAAIHAAAGPRIMLECRLIGGCPPGEARITSGGRLKARYIIHAVGPVYRDGRSGEAAVLASAYRSSLELASAYGLRSVAFPAISTGIYGYPMAEAARIALKTIVAYLCTQPTSLRLVRMVLYSDEAYRTFIQACAIVARSM